MTGKEERPPILDNEIFISEEELSSLVKNESFMREIAQLLSGVKITTMTAKHFISVLAKARGEGFIKQAHNELGKLAVYCIGGTFRSPFFGEILNKLGFIFAHEETVRGGEIGKLIDAVPNSILNEFKVRFEGAAYPIDTIVISIDLTNSSDVSNIGSFLLKLSRKHAAKYGLRVLVIDLDDTVGDRTDALIFAQQAFPDLNIRQMPDVGFRR